ncbi:NADH dehydrogenase [Striga asiatica]|uniref:NADH dehydrogenase n=1 Tax=Striga asiatica TaxID=4170 RepID=A0A5A7RHP6_STRAF|nr:NADH dehydrogenase [Striga asiatica]
MNDIPILSELDPETTVDRRSTISLQLPNILTLVNLSFPSLILTGTSILRSKGIRPVICSSCKASSRAHTQHCCVVVSLVESGQRTLAKVCFFVPHAHVAPSLIVYTDLFIGVVGRDSDIEPSVEAEVEIECEVVDRVLREFWLENEVDNACSGSYDDEQEDEEADCPT